MGLETARQHLVEMIGDFHVYASSWFKSAASSKLSWWARCVPEDKTLVVHEVEMNDGEAIILIHPYRQNWFSGRALRADGRGGELNLLIGHALNGDLTGGPAPKRWDDDESIVPRPRGGDWPA